jgi:hypothetical protein
MCMAAVVPAILRLQSGPILAATGLSIQFRRYRQQCYGRWLLAPASTFTLTLRCCHHTLLRRRPLPVRLLRQPLRQPLRWYPGLYC